MNDRKTPDRPFEQLIQTIESLEQGQELTEGKLHQLLALIERGEDLREGAERMRGIGRCLWGMPLVDAIHEYRLAEREAEGIARAAEEGEELQRRLLCTLHTRGTIVHLVERAWQCRSRLPGKGVRLLRRAVQLSDDLLRAEDLDSIQHEDTPGHDYLQALWRPTVWRHPREGLSGEYRHLRPGANPSDPGAWRTARPSGQAANVAPFREKPGEQGRDRTRLREEDFLGGRTVTEGEHQLHDRVRTRAYLANALRTVGRLDAAAEIFRQVDRLLAPELWFLPAPDSLIGEVCSLRAAFHQDIGDLPEAEASATRAYQLLSRAGNVEGAAIQRVQLMAILYDDGRPQEVLRQRGNLREVPDWLHSYWRHTVAAAYADLGLVAPARRHYERLESPDTPRAKAAFTLLKANILRLEGESSAAQEAFQSAQRLYSVVGSPGEVLLALIGEALMLCHDSRLDDACSLVVGGTPLVSAVPDRRVIAAFKVVFDAARSGVLTTKALQAFALAARRARKKG